MRRRLLLIHRRLSLAFCAFWALQAATGLLLVFHVEIDNALTPGASAPLNPSAMGAALEQLSARAGTPVVSITAADRAGERYDVFTVDDEHRFARVAGDGALVATEAGLWAARAFDKLKLFHYSLLAGDLGLALVGLSGFLLLSNLTLGLMMAWPAASRWRQALWPRRAANPAVGAYDRHRATGLAFAAPALALVLGGFAMIAVDPFAGALGVGRAAPQAPPIAAPLSLRFDEAVGQALARYPGARVSVVNLPTVDRPWFRMRLRQRGELQRYYGGTEVYIDARSGRILADYDAHSAPAARAAADALFPLHTVEFLGGVGRLLALGVGLWVLAMIALGVRLCLSRRAGSAPTQRREPS